MKNDFMLSEFLCSDFRSGIVVRLRKPMIPFMHQGYLSEDDHIGKML